MYLLTACLAAFFAWYGVRQRSRLLINFGSAGFAATVLWFYFSSVMDKLGRSFSLIALGRAFPAGRLAAGEGSAAAGSPHFPGGVGMKLTKRAVLLIVIQVLLVSTIAREVSLRAQGLPEGVDAGGAGGS